MEPEISSHGYFFPLSDFLLRISFGARPEGACCLCGALTRHSVERQDWWAMVCRTCLYEAHDAPLTVAQRMLRWV
jgi:hypothetical protein